MIGGSNGRYLDSIISLNLDTFEFSTDYPPLPGKRCGCAAALVSSLQQIVVVGGYDGKRLASTRLYSLKTKKWTKLPDMSKPRYLCACVAVGTHVFCIGGEDAQGGILSNMEVLDVSDPKRKWTTVPASMSTGRYGCAATAAGRKLYILGGHNGSRALKTCEMFDLETQYWSILPHMNSERCGCAVAAIRDMVVVAGGATVGPDNCRKALDTVEVFDLQNKKWDDLPPMSTKRWLLAICATQDSVIVAGGWDCKGTRLNTAERLLAKTAFPVPPSLPQPPSAKAAKSAWQSWVKHVTAVSKECKQTQQSQWAKLTKEQVDDKKKLDEAIRVLRRAFEDRTTERNAQLHEMNRMFENWFQVTNRQLQEAQKRIHQLPHENVVVAGGPPSYFLCPITLELMQDPVIAADGHTYERKAIRNFIASSNKAPRSPMTNKALAHTHLTPNIAIRGQIKDYLEENHNNEDGVLRLQ